MPLAAGAAGLGGLTVISGLGEPLNAEIELLSATNDELSSLSAHIATADTYAEQSIERASALGSIRVELSKKPDGTPILKLTTPQPIDDPFLDMLIQVDWSSGRLLREYTALLDPPGFGSQTGVTNVAAPVVQAPVALAEASGTKQKPEKRGKSHKTAGVAQSVAGGAEQPLQAPGGEGYTTERGDTLRAIASKMQVEGISLEQMLVGLYQANQEAFVGDNMNRLKVGQIIRQPSAEELQAIGKSDAVKEIRIQTADWNAYRNKLASAVAESVPAKEEAPRQAASGKITAPAVEKGQLPATGPRDVVKLSKSEITSAKVGGAASEPKAGTQEKISAMQEEAIARGKAVKEANERVASLEKQVKKMEKLLEIKSQTMAGVQNAAVEQKSQPPKPAASPLAPASTTDVPQPEPVAAPAARPEARSEPAKAAEAKPEAGNPKHKPKKIVRHTVETKTGPGFVDALLDRLPLVGAVLALFAALGGGVWFYFRNKRRKGLDAFEQGILTTGGLKPNTVFGNTAGGTVDTGDTSFLTDFSQSGGGGMIDTNDVDPIAEAEVYMAYGRDTQAEEILKDAIQKDPKRNELHLKLLEIYANRKDNAAFETLAGELYATMGATDPDWAKAADLGRKMDPGNPLYAAQPTAKTSGASTDATQIFKAPTEAVAGEVVEPSLDFSLDAGMDAAEAPAIEGALDGSPQAEALDFNVGMLTVPEAETVAADDIVPDLDISGATEAVETAVERPVAEEETAETAGLDFELGLPELHAETPVEPSVTEAETAESAGLDFELGLPEEPIGPLAETPAAEIEAGETVFDLGLPEPPAEESVQLEATELGIETLPENEELMEISEAEESVAEAPEIAAAEEPEKISMEQFSAAAFTEEAVVAEPEPQLEVPQLSTDDAEVGLDKTLVLKVPPAPETPVAEQAGEDETIVLETSPSDTEELDFDFDVDLGQTESAPLSKPQESTPTVPDLDLSGISLDLGAGEQAVEGGEEITLSGTESSDVDTKLDLVTAYLDMGDKEGARELLQEVLDEGGPQQRERAQQMMDSLG